MKHPKNVTLILVIYFTIVQIFGLFAMYYQLKHNPITSSFSPSYSFLNLFIDLIVATGLFLLLLKFRMKKSIMTWYVLSLSLTIFMTLNVFFPLIISVMGTIVLIFIKFKTRFSNLAEIFIYPGLSNFIALILNLRYAMFLMILMSFYDFYSVRISKHMIYLAKGGMENNNFMGLKVAYNNRKSSVTANNKKAKNKVSAPKNVAKMMPDSYNKTPMTETSEFAILGGGDLAFALIFTDVVLLYVGLFSALFTLVASVIGISFLFFISSKKKFYPALPYLTLFQFIGLLISMLL